MSFHKRIQNKYSFLVSWYNDFIEKIDMNGGYYGNIRNY